MAIGFLGRVGYKAMIDACVGCRTSVVNSEFHFLIPSLLTRGK